MNSKIGVKRGLENSVVASKIAKIIFKKLRNARCGQHTLTLQTAQVGIGKIKFHFFNLFFSTPLFCGNKFDQRNMINNR